MLHLQLSMTDCCFATKNLAHIHKRKSVFLPLTHKSLLLNRGVGQRMEGVTFRSSPWDGMEAKHTPHVRIIGISWVQPHLLKYLDGLFQVFQKENLTNPQRNTLPELIIKNRRQQACERFKSVPLFFGSSLHLISFEKTWLLEMSDAEVISSCEASGDWQIALALLHQMIDISLRQDAYSYSAVMNKVARFFFVSKNWSWNPQRSYPQVSINLVKWRLRSSTQEEITPRILRFFVVIPINLCLPPLPGRGASDVLLFYLDF